jgi:riboflavin kinase/FMN adenylyltransferase
LKVYYSLDEIPHIKSAVVSLGTFDGVHTGHQKVISLLRKSADEINGETVIFTFHPHPRIVLYPDDHGLNLIQSIDERIKKLASFGIDHLVLFPFTREFSRLSARDFVKEILVKKLKTEVLAIGYNHHFGRNREGDIHLLKTMSAVHHFKVLEIPAFTEGKVSLAANYLGNYFQFECEVVHGHQIGRTLGFPTANLVPTNQHQLLPKKGVYAVGIIYQGVHYQGMMNIGSRPTLSDDHNLSIEVNLFDFDQTIYGEKLMLVVYEWIRDEQHFNSLNDLQEQLKHDKIECLAVLDGLNVGKL